MKNLDREFCRPEVTWAIQSRNWLSWLELEVHFPGEPIMHPVVTLSPCKPLEALITIVRVTDVCLELRLAVREEMEAL